MPVPRAPAAVLALALAAAAAPAHATEPAPPPGAERTGAPARSAGPTTPAASEMAVPPVPRESAAAADAEKRRTYRVIAWFAAFALVGFVVFAIALRRRSPGR